MMNQAYPLVNQVPMMANQIPMVMQQNPTLDPTSPYFLHRSESPGSLLTPIVFTGKNCHSWARAMRVAFKSKNKLRFVDGTLMEPDEDDPLSIARYCRGADTAGTSNDSAQAIAEPYSRFFDCGSVFH